MKWWQIILIVFAGMFVLVGFVGALEESAGNLDETAAKTDTERHQEAYDDIPLPDKKEAEEVPVAPVEESKPVVDIYNTIQLDMTENEVVALVGEPDSTNEVNIEGFGKSKDLDYNGLDYDNVTITVDNGLVTAVTLAEWDGDDLNLVSKNK